MPAMASRRLCAALILLLACCLLLFAPGAEAAPSPFRVQEYNTRVEIETSGDIHVTEDITISVPTSGTNKGIIRDIPINTRWHERGRKNVRLKVEEVSIDGKPCPTDDTEQNFPILSICMRDTQQYLEAGEHRFRLRYRMSEQIGFFENEDELTWNAVGEGWAGGVQKARATIIPPPGTSFTQHRAWLGQRGSHDSPVDVRTKTIRGRDALVFKAQRPLREGEVFTCAVAWPEGIVTAPDLSTPADSEGYTLFCTACFLGSLAAAWALWKRYGKDPEGGPVIPQFYPPQVPQRLRGKTGEASARSGRATRNKHVHGEEYMTPVAVHYVHEGGKLEANGLAALFLSLAQRGDCHLRGTATRGVVVEKIANTSPAPEERVAANKIPRQLSLAARTSTHSPIGKIHDACQLRLEGDYPMQMRWNLWPQVLLFLAAAAVVSLAAFIQLGDNLTEHVMEELAEAAGGGLMVFGGLAGAGLLLRKALRQKRLSKDNLTLLLFCIFLAVTGYPILRDADGLEIFNTLQWVTMLGCLLAPIAFGFLMDMPSREQVELRQHVKGLALYIGTAETERFNFANPPEEDLQLYHRLLPYAVALGLEAAWGKRFAHQLAQALASEEAYTEALTQDLVYSSRISLSSYRDAVFAEQAAKTAASPRGGSSFSGFGGGAGSGGGGGGGRAC